MRLLRELTLMRRGIDMDARTRLLLEGPVGTTILRLSLPNVIVMVVQTPHRPSRNLESG